MAYRDFVASRVTKMACQVLLALFAVAGTLAFGQGAPGGDEDEGQAGAAGAESEAPGFADRPMLRTGFDSHALARRYPDLAVWLEPGDFTPVLALFEPETTADSRGSILLLGDQGQSANAPLLEDLRRRLAAAGWGTLSLGVEEAPPAVMEAIRQRTAAAANQSAGSGRETSEEAEGVSSVMIDVNDDTSADVLERYYLQHHARMTEGVSWLGGQGYGEQVVVAVGWSAELVHQALSSGLPGLTRVVWIAPDFAAADEDKLIQAFRSKSVLDLYAGEPGTQRAAAFRRAAVEGYQGSVVAIGSRPVERDAAALAGRIISWLKR